ncbi:MAG TPA: Xaa-Pro peptidase family protein [Pseudonocardia sp.]|uniref:M24 family metallopeptidase n=1 Tax=Pseudonocardia sp. TaxID=60912 RepID=UPI002C5463A2|nr:Xaa-Pro peptidase family protein [Pseudonocardia sp.]HTF49960.1 Xaa-Pro peptidase family protein [Pseudonocardia sp.]
MTPAARRDALRALLRTAELDALLVTDLVNVRYLSGFTGSNAALLVPADGERGTRLATDGRYTTQAAAEVPDVPVLIERACARALVADAGAAGIRRLGFESGHLTVDAHAALLEVARDNGELELRRAPGLVQRLRAVKDETEIEALRTACAAADAALADLIAAGGLRPGRTEREVAADLEQRMRQHGADGPAFDTIVAAGANSAIPHHQPTDAVLAEGDLVKMDFGALRGGYHSDMTRTVVLGRPTDWQRELYELVAAAQAAGRAALGVGVEVASVDAAARDVITEAGRGAEFSHGLGHGVGLEIHEAPALSATGAGTLASGMAVTVEPGVYLAGRGGVRIEDTLVVRPDGAELLTLTGKELLAL